jgi:small-conductance mechanosensitive channel
MDVRKKPERYLSLKKLTGPKANQRRKIWLGSYIILSLAFLAFYFLVRLDLFSAIGSSRRYLESISMAASVSCIVLFIGKLIEIIIIKKSHTDSTKYNLLGLTNFIKVIVIALIILSFVFSNWYTAAVSFGLISLILGFALQTPISSLAGWVYILIRNPYRIGDRIQLNDFKGDVVEISYLDTTLWEFAGDYLTNDLPSGRLIRFPNSLVFTSAVYNYSWQKFPFIWNEIPFHVAYESDLSYVSSVIRQTTIDELGDEAVDNIKYFKELASQTAVDLSEVKEYPFVSLRINANTWVEVSVTYLVHPKKAATKRSAIISRILKSLNEKPEKVLFPNSNAR